MNITYLIHVIYILLCYLTFTVVGREDVINFSVNVFEMTDESYLP